MAGEASLACVAPGPSGRPPPSLLLAGKGLQNAGAATAELGKQAFHFNSVFRSLKPSETQAARSTCSLVGGRGQGARAPQTPAPVKPR